MSDRHLVLVVGHHPLVTVRNDGCQDYKSVKRSDDQGCADMLRERLGRIAKSRNLVAYLTGHKHQHYITLESARVDSKLHKFWEIQTASIIGFPQEARWITLRRLDDRIAFLELIPFGHGYTLDDSTPFRQALARAQRGAKRDKCRKKPCVDGEPIRTDDQYGPVRLFFELPNKQVARDRAGSPGLGLPDKHSRQRLARFSPRAPE